MQQTKKESGTVWILKKIPDGKDVWAQVPLDSIRKDGSKWRCSNCIRVETPTPLIGKKEESRKVEQDKEKTRKKVEEKIQKTKVICIGGMCKVQPKEGRYYEFTDSQVSTAISIHGATYGDILSRQNTYKCEDTFIVNKHGMPEKLSVDLNTKCIIPDPYLKDLGIFYWENISSEASLAHIYNRERFEQIRQMVKDGQVHMNGLLQQYGPVIVAELVSKPPAQVVKKAPKKTAKPKVVKKAPKKASKPKVVKKVTTKTTKRRLEERTITELRELAAKRGRKIPSGATKAQIVKLLRGKPATAKKGSRRGCYEAMTKAELMKRASDRKIDGRSQMSKEQLIKALRKK